MMRTWRYQAVRNQQDGHIQIHEVHIEDGKIVAWTANPVCPGGDTTTELQLDLQRMLNAIREHGFIDESNLPG